jgi:hypothetical protein
MYNLDQVTHKQIKVSFGLLFVCEWLGPGYTSINGLLFVCEWLGPGYTSINSGKNAFIPIVYKTIVRHNSETIVK